MEKSDNRCKKRGRKPSLRSSRGRPRGRKTTAAGCSNNGDTKKNNPQHSFNPVTSYSSLFDSSDENGDSYDQRDLIDRLQANSEDEDHCSDVASLGSASKNQEESNSEQWMSHSTEEDYGNSAESFDDTSVFLPVEAVPGFSSTPTEKNSSSTDDFHDASVTRRSSSRFEEDFEIMSNDEPNQVEFFWEHTKNVVVLVMQVPSAITFYGQAQIRALSGTVNICGFNVTTNNQRFYSIFSSHQIFSFQIKATNYQLKSGPHMEEIENFLKETFSAHKISTIFESCTYSSAIVMLKGHDVTKAVDFVSLYLPDVFAPPFDTPKEAKLMHRFRKFSFSFDDKNVFYEPYCYTSVSSGVMKDIKEKDSYFGSGAGDTASHILVYGARGTGKSTFLRYLINQVLSEYPKVMYLDLDPGQTEFTPPACLSLSEITHPLLGPNFTHIRTPVKMKFYGSVSVEPLEYYISCVEDLYTFYYENYRSVPLFINTFGWIVGIGKTFFEKAKKIVKPTFVVKMEIPDDDDDDILNFSPNPFFDGDRSMITLLSARPTEKTFVLAADRRDLTVLAYLGQCQPYYDPPKYLNSFRPYKVKVSDVVIHLIHYDIDPNLRMGAINGSFVALTTVSDDDIMINTEQLNWPKQLKESPEGGVGECIGFAFVRAVDETNGIIYFVTPEPPEKVALVNAFVKGNVRVPPVLYKNQNIYGVTLPNMRQLTAKKTHGSRAIGVQKKFISRE